MNGSWEDREGIRAWGTGRAGKSSRKPRRPRPYSRALAGISLRSKYVHCPRPWRPANFITTRHAASLRPPRNGRIGFKPPYSKRGEQSRTVHVGLATAVTPNAEKPTPCLGGCAPPPPPRPLSLDRQRKGGKKARPWRRRRAFACDALRPPCPSARTRASRESCAQAHAQKPSSPQAPARGKKRRTGHPTENALPLELEVRD